MVKIICNTDDIHPVSKLFRQLGLLNAEDIYSITVPFNGWFNKSAIVGRIHYKKIEYGNGNNIPLSCKYIPTKIFVCRDMKTCVMVAKELEELYKGDLIENNIKEIEVEFVSKDYYDPINHYLG